MAHFLCNTNATRATAYGPTALFHYHRFEPSLVACSARMSHLRLHCCLRHRGVHACLDRSATLAMRRTSLAVPVHLGLYRHVAAAHAQQDFNISSSSLWQHRAVSTCEMPWRFYVQCPFTLKPATGRSSMQATPDVYAMKADLSI